MDVYQELRQHFADDPRVTVNAGKGAQGIKVKVKNKDRMIIMFSKGHLLLKMPPATVEELIGKNKGLSYEVSPGRVMKDRILVPVSKTHSWISICERAIEESLEL